MNPTFKISSRDAAHLLRGLVEVNKAQHERHIKNGGDPFSVIKAIQDGRIRYKRADPREHWQSYNELLEIADNSMGAVQGKRSAVQGKRSAVQGKRSAVRGADCEDLASAVVAELNAAGIDARTYVYKARPGLYHVIVKTEKWGFLDPSVSAGMKKV